ncbi:hypothetical protein PPGU19_011970 [Paraburkholderia sp. PGU19]|uniref:hypothetical protein n=1 Tax=Paraburkholderia sp. PGU19 TaxID=2735434 RepID=UPI0015DB15D7|nr:hypothetical protein [Paraburkholderia sp. PGU19]BCF96628.1 hypothetical protein PPGU19_011970 [Paraburkholderia sp. PGU19]
MSIRSLAARGLSFAHLASLSNRASKAEDDEEKKDARAEGDSDDEEENTDRNRDDGDSKKSKKARAEDDDDDGAEDDGQKSGKKAKKAEDGDESKDYAEEDDDDGAEDDGQKSGKRAEEDGDDEDEEMRGKSAVARARRREQARCAAIMGHKAAGRNVVLAANLAFNTRMGRKEAIAVLQATPAASTPGQGRQARNPNLGAGGEMHRNPQREASAGWDRAFSKATGKRA